MNLVKNSNLHLREDEALVVENAIRLAIDSIVNVLFGVRGGRNRELQVMVAERDKEIQRLGGRLGEVEKEVLVMRRQGCICGVSGAQSAGEPQRLNPESNPTQQECDMSINFGVLARPPSHVSSQSQESATSFSSNRLVLDQSCTSQSSENLCGHESNGIEASSEGRVVVKEEPCDVDAIFIKMEMTDERLVDHQDTTGSSYVDNENSLIPENRCETSMVENPFGGHGPSESELLRNRKKGTPMSALTEEAQRQKRAAWREASRRYYARKVARQQAAPRHPAGPYQYLVNSEQFQTMTLGESKRKRIHELPPNSQEHQREVWRAASRRYYSQKLARHQPGHQFETLLQNVEPSGEMPEQNGGASGSGGGGGGGGLGGIMCS